MLLEIWFPQIVIVLGTLGALLCFAMVFSSVGNNEEHGHEEHHHDH